MASTETLKEGVIEEQVYLFDNNHFPCFVEGGEDIEDPDTAPNENEKKSRVARNALRNLTYGTPFKASKLLTWSNFKFLFIKKDPVLMKKLREEMQNVFLNVYNRLQQNRLGEDAQRRLEIFINTLLAAYPFMDPESNEVVKLPQRINNQWELVDYHFEKIDISPQTGLLSKLIEDEDRIYAYGLVPNSNEKAQPYVSFIGTTYPSGQGAELNWLYNLKPGYSVGEGHDLTLLEKWLNHHDKVKLVGHSKGGTMAMIAAAKYPEKVSSAHCLSPTALCESTVNRLSSTWDKIPDEKKPTINVYSHVADPIFLLENSFLEGTRIFRFGKKDDKESFLAAHIHYFAGRRSTYITEVTNIKQDIRSKSREFGTSLKEILNWVLFPLLYTKIVYELCTRKIKRFYDNHRRVIKFALFGLALGTCIALAATGVLAPLAAAMVPLVGAAGAGAILGTAAVVGSGLTAAVAPEVCKFTESVVSKSIFFTLSAIAISSVVFVGGFFSLIKIGIKSLFHREPKPSPPTTHKEQSNPHPKKDTTHWLKSEMKRAASEADLSHHISASNVKSKEQETQKQTDGQLHRSKSDSNLLKFFKEKTHEEFFKEQEDAPSNKKSM